MSDDHQVHQSPIRTPKQLIIAIVASFIIPIIVILLLVSYVVSMDKKGAGSNGMTQETVAARIAPVAQIQLTDPNAPKVLRSGEDVFKAVCASCHGAGIAGAPKSGDATAWAARIKEGAETLYKHAIQGYQGKSGVMPAKGGNSDLDDLEVERAVVYMANASGASFKEPVATAAPAPAATSTEDAAAAASAPSPSVVAALAAANSAAPAPVAAAGGADAGKNLFNSACIACHGAGVAGAPKVGDKEAWAPRIAQGMETLYTHAINGFQGKNGVMPPKGGASASDDDVKAAVRFMAASSK